MIAFGSEDTIFLGSLASYCSIHDVYELCLMLRLNCVFEVSADAMVRLCAAGDGYDVTPVKVYNPRALNHRFIPARFSVAPVLIHIMSLITSSAVLSASILHPHE